MHVGKKRIEHKVQSYNPHGSISAVDTKSGSIFHIGATQVDPERGQKLR